MGAYLQKCPICAEEFRAPVDGKLTVETNAALQLDRHMEAIHPEAMFYCPRGAGPDTPFKPPFNGHAHWRGDHTCSYCGSVSPDKFFEAVEAGAKVGPTDKSYKAYIDLPEDNPEARRIFSATSAEERPTGEGWVAIADIDDETLRENNWGRSDYKWVQFGPRGATRFGKFYFQHLNEAEMHRFIDLVNTKRMNIGVPGYFYRAPFFCAPAKPAAA